MAFASWNLEIRLSMGMRHLRSMSDWIRFILRRAMNWHGRISRKRSPSRTGQGTYRVLKTVTFRGRLSTCDVRSRSSRGMVLTTGWSRSTSICSGWLAGRGGLGGPDRVQDGQVIGVGQGLVAGLGGRVLLAIVV